MKVRSTIENVVFWVTLGTVAWIGAGIGGLIFGAEPKVIWTCVVGALLGLVGIRYSIRRNKRSGI